MSRQVLARLWAALRPWWSSVRSLQFHESARLGASMLHRCTIVAWRLGGASARITPAGILRYQSLLIQPVGVGLGRTGVRCCNSGDTNRRLTSGGRWARGSFKY